MKKIKFIAAFLCLLMINVTPVNASEPSPKVTDGAELLTEEEETKLTARINELVDKYQIDIIIATEHDKTASTIQDEADLMYDNNGYGIGDSKDGILFLVAKDPGEYAISTTGNAIAMFSDNDLDKLGGDAASNYFSDGNFYQGFDSYLSALDVDLNQALAEKDSDSSDTLSEDNDKPASSDADDKEEADEPRNPLPTALIAGLIITMISMSITKSGMKTANMQSNADAYQEKDAASNIKQKDVFLTTNITKRPLPKDDNKTQSRSNSKTTVHKSSNGRTHGGSSGKF